MRIAVRALVADPCGTIAPMNRRGFLGTLGAVAAAPAAASAAGVLRFSDSLGSALPAIRPRRLSVGDTVALVAPASATFQTIDVDIARESLEALGLKVRSGRHLLARHGYLAGGDKDRAADINAVANNPLTQGELDGREYLSHGDFE